MSVTCRLHVGYTSRGNIFVLLRARPKRNNYSWGERSNTTACHLYCFYTCGGYAISTTLTVPRVSAPL